MKKKLLKLIPYMLGLAYLTYCLIIIESWVKAHLDHGLFVGISWIIGVISLIVLLFLRFIEKKKCSFYLPVFFFAIGYIVHIVASNIPCCVGG